MARILVIDDDDAVRLSLKLALEDADHHVEDAAIFMPEKEGLETIDEIKRDCPQTKIIAISGGGSMDPENYLLIAKRVGADRSLFKPFDIQLLLATVDDLLGARKELGGEPIGR